MATSIKRGWTRGPFGYRDAQLEGADFTAALTLFVAGIPALLVGADLAARGIGFSQLILAAPIGALLGAAMVGLMGRKASASGSNRRFRRTKRSSYIGLRTRAGRKRSWTTCSCCRDCTLSNVV